MFGGFEDLLRRLSLDVTSLANALRDVLASPIVRGQLVTVVMLSGATTVTSKHSLGRPAQAAAVIGASAAGAFTVDLISGTGDSITVRASSAVGSNVTIRLWVF
jgi:hypothetical protein